MKVRLLHTTGNGRFEETTWDKPDITDDEIEVRAVMTGVCRSDIAMMCGEFGPLPLHMQGHEGLGQVTRAGKNINNVKVGDYVATRGEPAYADFYNVRAGEFVFVPEAHPRYILEPVACALNLLGHASSLYTEQIMSGRNRVLLLGTGFLAQVVYQAIAPAAQNSGLSIDVVGKSNGEHFPRLIEEPNGQYDIIVDLSDKDWVFTRDIVKSNALVIMGNQKPITTDFSNLLWKSCTMTFPSPRSSEFLDAMIQAEVAVEQGRLKVDHLWTNAYSRDTEWQQAFSDGLNRPRGYGRGYIVWN